MFYDLWTRIYTGLATQGLKLSKKILKNTMGDNTLAVDWMTTEETWFSFVKYAWPSSYACHWSISTNDMPKI